MDNRTLIMHDSGHDACGKPAFFSLVPLLNFGTEPSSKAADIETLDGKHPPIGEFLECGSCGKTWQKLITSAYIICPR